MMWPFDFMNYWPLGFVALALALQLVRVWDKVLEPKLKARRAKKKELSLEEREAEADRLLYAEDPSLAVELGYEEPKPKTDLSPLFSPLTHPFPTPYASLPYASQASQQQAMMQNEFMKQQALDCSSTVQAKLQALQMNHRSFGLEPLSQLANEIHGARCPCWLCKQSKG